MAWLMTLCKGRTVHYSTISKDDRNVNIVSKYV
jgi:hypothetical protein